MKTINIDELCEPIEITIREKKYVLEDISRELMTKIDKVARKAKAAEEAIKEASTDSDVIDEEIMKASMKSNEEMAAIMSEVMGGDKDEFISLGMRKLNRLVQEVMGSINEEIEGKKDPKVEQVK